MAERVAIWGYALPSTSLPSQAVAENIHLHLWPGLPADTADHPLTWPVPPLQKNPPQARFHSQVTRRPHIFPEYLDT